jgi:hypothetical protein
MISELISQLSTSPSPKTALELEDMFLDTPVGISVTGLPQRAPGTKYIAGKNELKIKFVVDPNGKHMIKACADPETFVKNYQENITATMTGREIIEMILEMPNIDGVLICSATSFNSYPIYKDRGKMLLNNKREKSNKSWWQFWKSSR